MLYNIIIYAFFCLIIPLDQKESAKDYIDQHKMLAIQEMERSGIPASIKMAQALLESNYGKSELASKANNHFGIKCGNKWTGDTFYKQDDDYVKGKLVKSCFRKFNSVQESFIAHSDFLKDPNKKYRYGFLFKYDKTDYESWAYGLYDAGYATDPSYPEKLLVIIKQYELYQYDTAGAGQRNKQDITDSYTPRTYEASTPKKKTRKETRSTKSSEKKGSQTRPTVNTERINPKSETAAEAAFEASSYSKDGAYRKKEVNYVPLVIAKGNETLMTFCKENQISLKDAIKYNERLNSSADILEEGEYIYTKEKKNNFVGNKEVHKVKRDETMYDIAQKYGIKLNSLYAKNRLPKYAQVLAGEKINLQGKVKLGDRPRFIDMSKDKRSDSKFLF